METIHAQYEKIIERFKGTLASLRTGRASPALVEDLLVDYYGTPTPIKTLASISAQGPREIVIQPWDKNAIQPIERAIQASSLGLSPVTDRTVIRIMIPALTEERRREMTKLLGRHLEDARIQVRRVREDAIREIDRKEKAKEISEDQKFRSKNEIQKIVDETNKKIEEIAAAKEKEIMSV